MDSDALLQCPYDKHHMIRRSRYQTHLVKCAANNKAVAKGLATCPFNACHRVPKKELELHMQTCENKCTLEPLSAIGEVNYEVENLSTWQSPPCEENWEEESETKRFTFVLQEYGNYCPYSYETSADNCTSSGNPTAKPTQRGNPTFGNSTVTQSQGCINSGNLAAKPNQGGYRNSEKHTARSIQGRCTKSEDLAVKPSQGYPNLGTTTKPIQEGYTNRPSAEKPSQGGYSNLGIAAKPIQEGYTNRPSAEKPSQGGYSNLGIAAKPIQEGYTNRPSAEMPNRGGYTNSGNPTVTKVHPWGTYQRASSANQAEPGNSYENEWPRLENLSIKERRQMK